jgi:hypothetical protein
MMDPWIRGFVDWKGLSVPWVGSCLALDWTGLERFPLVFFVILLFRYVSQTIYLIKYVFHELFDLVTAKLFCSSMLATDHYFNVLHS